VKHSRADLDTLSLQITAAAERIRRQRRLVETLSAAHQETWKPVQALNGMEATLSELMIRRDAIALEFKLRTLGGQAH